MGASRNISESRLFIGSYGESSSKSFPAILTNEMLLKTNNEMLYELLNHS